MYQNSHPLGERSSEPASTSPQQQAQSPGASDFPVLRNAVEAFVVPERNRSQQQQTFAALADHFLDQAPREERRYAAVLLSSRADAPHSTVWKLAQDDLDIATPILSRSPVLTSVDLATLVDQGNTKMSAVIASRSDLTKALTEKLAAQDDQDILDALLQNASAPLVSKLIDTVLESATDKPEQMDLVAARTDTDAEALARLFLHLDTEQRQRALVICEARAALEAMLPGASAPVEAPSNDDIKLLEKYALSSQLDAFSAQLSALSHLPEDKIERVLNDKNGEAIVILLASLGLEEASIVRILMFAVPHIGSDYSAIKRLAALRSQLSPRTAQFMTRQWAHEAASVAGQEQLNMSLDVAPEPKPFSERSSEPRLTQSRSMAEPVARPAIKPEPVAFSRSRRLPIFGRRRG